MDKKRWWDKTIPELWDHFRWWITKGERKELEWLRNDRELCVAQNLIMWDGLKQIGNRFPGTIIRGTIRDLMNKTNTVIWEAEDYKP